MNRYAKKAMTKGLAKRLLVSTPYRNDARRELVLVSCDTQTISSIPFSDLTPTDWGFVYERHVGVHYETLGYTVDYRGFRLGLFDSGIDLVAAKTDMPTCYVQCKATQKKFGKQAIETILYKGGNFISKDIAGMDGPPPDFVLAVLDKDKNMSVYNQHRFLRHNKTQSRTTLSILSLPWASYTPSYNE